MNLDTRKHGPMNGTHAGHPKLEYRTVKLEDGRSVQLFVNLETNLVVLDIINKRGTGGVEVYWKRV